MTVAIVGAGAVSPFGLDWRALGGEQSPHVATLLASSHADVRGFEVPAIAAEQDAGDIKSRRLMSRSARFAAIAAREALRSAAWADRADIGFWLGVGASGGPLGELVAMLKIAREGDTVSMARLGSEGLLASNPLNTFQVLNNFAMCHGAILEGTRGPNGAFFSRGAGTVHALVEAVHAIDDGDCQRALVGGADTALHPVTWAELVRDGFAADGLVPSEGAAVIALARADLARSPLAIVERACVGDAAARLGDGDLVVIAPWGDAARSRLRELAHGEHVVDASLVLGESLAATPALAWSLALAWMTARGLRRAVVLSLGTDGELGGVVLGGAT